MRMFLRIGSIVSAVALVLVSIGYVTYRWTSNQVVLSNDYEIGAIEES